MAKNRIKCPLCGEGFLEDEIADHETCVRKGNRTVKVMIKDVAIKRCSKCREDFLPQEAVRKLDSERHKTRGLLNQEELKAIRMRLGYTQEEMAELLGLGKKTYFRWEKGIFLQNKAMDRYLRLISEIPENITILKRIARLNRKDKSDTE